MTFPMPFFAPVTAAPSVVAITAQGSAVYTKGGDSTSFSQTVDIGTDSGLVVICVAITAANAGTSSIDSCTVAGNGATAVSGTGWWLDEQGGEIYYVDVGASTGSVTVSITVADSMNGYCHMHAFRVSGSTGTPVDSTVTTGTGATNPRTTGGVMSCSAGGGMIGVIGNRNRTVNYSSPSFGTDATIETDAGGSNNGTCYCASEDFASAQTNIAWSVTTSDTNGQPYGIAAVAFDPA